MSSDKSFVETPTAIPIGTGQLIAVMHLPSDPSKRVPGVVFCHGFTGNKFESHRLFIAIARRLAERGIASLRFDYRGSGDSSGEFSDMTLATLKEDVGTASAFWSEHPQVDAGKMGLLGMSMGGMMGVLTLADDHPFLAGVLLCPVYDPSILAIERATPEREQAWAQTGVADLGGWPLGRRFIRDMMDVKPSLAASDIRVPTLFVHGTDDRAEGWRSGAGPGQPRRQPYHRLCGQDDRRASRLGNGYAKPSRSRYRV